MLCILLKKREFISCCGPWLNIIILNLCRMLINIQLHKKIKTPTSLLCFVPTNNLYLPQFTTFLHLNLSYSQEKANVTTLSFSYAIFSYTEQCVSHITCMCLWFGHFYIGKVCLSYLPLNQFSSTQHNEVSWMVSHTIRVRKDSKHSSSNSLSV